MVLFVVPPSLRVQWYAPFASEISGRFDLCELDAAASLRPQFLGVSYVVDIGGQASRFHVDLAAEVGVRLWQSTTVGLDHVDVDYILSRGLRFAHSPGSSSAVALAEHALLLMFSVAKRLPEAERALIEGRWCEFVGAELDGSTLGLVGLGASGRELARRASALGMRVIATDEAPLNDSELRLLGVEHCGLPDELDGLLGESDYISLHIPLTPQTRNLLDARRIALLRPSAVLINVARGKLVDEQALTKALVERRLYGAGLDVLAIEPPDPENSLLQLDTVVLTPHIAGATRGTARRRVRVAVENIARVERAQAPLFEVTLAHREGGTAPTNREQR
jgi:phosphoglycerate dehydrogenase-like enzyme